MDVTVSNTPTGTTKFRLLYTYSEIQNFSISKQEMKIETFVELSMLCGIIYVVFLCEIWVDLPKFYGFFYLPPTNVN